VDWFVKIQLWECSTSRIELRSYFGRSVIKAWEDGGKSTKRIMLTVLLTDVVLPRSTAATLPRFYSAKSRNRS
jgi:hypothetical protein